MPTAGVRKANCVFLAFKQVTYVEFLGIGYVIAAARRDGHDCTLIDVSLNEEDDRGDVVTRIANRNPDFIGLSLTSDMLPEGSAIGRAIRAKLGSNVHICAGGPVATYAGEKLLRHPEWEFLDSIVRGEGENAIGPLITKVLNGEPVRDIPGVALRGQLKSAQSFAIPAEDLDSVPWPARDQLEQQSQSIPFASIASSRGCTGRCTFCTAPHVGNVGKNRVWRGRSPERIVEEIGYLVSKYRVNTFRFVDSTYSDPGGKIGKERIRRIAELILQRGLNIYYHISDQSHNWSEDDADLLGLLYRSGLERVLIGVESGSDRMLKLLKKRATTDDNRRAIRLFRQNRVYVRVGFIMFHPYAEWQDIEDSANFLFESEGHQLERFMTHLSLHPGAAIVEQLATDGLLEPSFQEHFDPQGFRYLNPQIGRLSHSIDYLFGDCYSKRGIFPRYNTTEASVFAFSEFDLQLQTYITRLFRAAGDDSITRQAIEESQNRIDLEKAALRSFNERIFEDVLAHGKAGHDLPASMAQHIEEHYSRAIRQMEVIRLRLEMDLECRRKNPVKST